MDNIPQPIIVIAVLAFMIWYVFVRGSSNNSRKSLDKKRRELEGLSYDERIAKRKQAIRKIRRENNKDDGFFQ